MDNLKMKSCSKCKLVKDISLFVGVKNQETKQCKKCRDIKKRSRQKNKEKINIKEKEYREKNKDKINAKKREYMKEYREKNKEEIKIKERDYRQKNKDKINAKRSEWGKIKFTCPCGRVISNNHKSKHKYESMTHILYLKDMGDENYKEYLERYKKKFPKIAERMINQYEEDKMVKEWMALYYGEL